MAMSGYEQAMSGHEFEHHVAKVLKANGYRVRVTQGSGDFGVDLILDGRIAVQVKKYSSPVGPKAVQEVVAGMAFHKCTESWVVTNSTFTVAATRLAAANGVKLVPGTIFRALAAKAERPQFQTRAPRAPKVKDEYQGWNWTVICVLVYLFVLLYAADATNDQRAQPVVMLGLVVFGFVWAVIHFTVKAVKSAKVRGPDGSYSGGQQQKGKKTEITSSPARPSAETSQQQRKPDANRRLQVQAQYLNRRVNRKTD